MKTPLDLDNCAREPIHIPGTIQPHGALLVLDEPSLAVVAHSENAGAFLGRVPESAAALLTPAALAVLEDALARPDVRAANPLALTTRAPDERPLDGIVHRSGGYAILELEPAPRAAGVSFTSFYHDVRGAVLALQTAASEADVFRAACEEVRRITGFGRVMLYRFDDDWNGDVVGEARAPGMTSYLGTRFPHSDIPAQARALYTQNWLRLIVDVDYEPARIVPAARARSGEPLDLSFSVLRSVSPIHLEYLRNMDVRSSMSISVMKDDRLWALIACHDVEPRPVSYQVRNACEFLGQMLSYQLAAIEGREDYRLRRELQERRQRFQRGEIEIHEVPRATGAIRYVRGEVTTSGQVPSPESIDGLVAWLQGALAREEVFATHTLAKVYPPAAAMGETAAGLLALSLGGGDAGFVVWLRPELPRAVAWAGDPTAPVVRQADERLHPRKSFEIWKETVRLHAAPWHPADVDVARDLRTHLVAADLARANARLARSNEELDAFAAIASHDLKEPLRGIRNYLAFVVEDDGDKLTPGSRQKLESVGGIARRMDDLLGALYHFSRVGKVELAVRETDLNEVLRDVTARLRSFLDERKVELRVPHKLPTLRCDALRVGEIFHNLVSNAAKYTESDVPVVEVGVEPGGVLYVKDNGIGIEPRHFDTIFRVFRRLHSTTRFGGGTGTGLTIVKRIVERHGGRVWVESAVDGPRRGTTVRFTLGNATETPT